MYFFNLRPYRALLVVVLAAVLAVSAGAVEVAVSVTAGGSPLLQGEWGHGAGEFGLGRDTLGRPSGPSCITVDGAGRVYVADTHNRRVVRFARTGGLDRSWEVVLDGSLRPESIAVDGGDRLYVSVAGSTSVWRFDGRGSPLGSADVAGPEDGALRWVLDGIWPDRRAGFYAMVTGQGAGWTAKILRFDAGGVMTGTVSSWEVAPGADSGRRELLPEGFCTGCGGELFVSFRDDAFTVRVERWDPRGRLLWSKPVTGEVLIRASALIGGDSRGAYVALDYGGSAEVVLVPNRGAAVALAEIPPFRPPADLPSAAVPYSLLPGCARAGREVLFVDSTERLFSVRSLAVRSAPRFRLFGGCAPLEVDPCR